jgi:mannosyltransferase OCH1-like enzyme
MFSENLLAIARIAEHDPKYLYALLEHAVAEGAVRLLDRGVENPGTSGFPTNIPRRIMQYWHDVNPPDDVRQAAMKVRARNPGMAYAIFHEQAAREFVAANFGGEMRSLFDFCFHHTMKSDLFRLCYLHVHGGLYVDVDIDCHAPLENILANNDFRCFLFHAEGKPWCIENGFIAAEPGSGLIAAMLRNLELNLVQYRDRGRFRGIWADTGPGLATETVMRLLARHILSGEGTSPLAGFLTSRSGLQAVSYRHAELAYKQTAEGNWRKACPPRVTSGR